MNFRGDCFGEREFHISTDNLVMRIVADCVYTLESYIFVFFLYLKESRHSFLFNIRLLAIYYAR